MRRSWLVVVFVFTLSAVGIAAGQKTQAPLIPVTPATTAAQAGLAPSNLLANEPPLAGDEMHTTDTDFDLCDELEVGSETAWADGDRYVKRGNWATYTPYPPSDPVVLFAGRNMDAGLVTFVDNGDDTLTITLALNANWRFAEGDEENLHIQHYDLESGGVPQQNPSPGQFDYKSHEISGFGGTAMAVLPVADFYGIHAALENVVACALRDCADYGDFAPGDSIEGEGAVMPGLTIDAVGTAVKISEGQVPDVYGAPNNGSCDVSPYDYPTNGCLDPNGGFSDDETQNAVSAHFYTFAFDHAVHEFSLRMLDFGDFNPTLATDHLVEMKAYNGLVEVDTEVLSYTSPPQQNPRSSDLHGDMTCPVDSQDGGTGDACSAPPGSPGNYLWEVHSDEGISRVTLEFGVGYDPKTGFDHLCTTTYLTYSYE